VSTVSREVAGLCFREHRIIAKNSTAPAMPLKPPISACRFHRSELHCGCQNYVSN